MNVLLIEPNSLLGDVYRRALTARGHTVRWCRDAQAAVHAADGTTPDVVLLELQLPKHSGIEFLYEFRSYPEWQGVPVILHTLVPEQELESQRHHFGPLGIAAYLYKPQTSLVQLGRAVDETSLAPVA